MSSDSVNGSIPSVSSSLLDLRDYCYLYWLALGRYGHLAPPSRAGFAHLSGKLLAMIENLHDEIVNADRHIE
jgi:hypothetical protein